MSPARDCCCCCYCCRRCCELGCLPPQSEVYVTPSTREDWVVKEVVGDRYRRRAKSGPLCESLTIARQYCQYLPIHLLCVCVGVCLIPTLFCSQQLLCDLIQSDILTGFLFSFLCHFQIMFVNLAVANSITVRSCWTRSGMCSTLGQCEYPSFLRALSRSVFVRSIFLATPLQCYCRYTISPR